LQQIGGRAEDRLAIVVLEIIERPEQGLQIGQGGKRARIGTADATLAAFTPLNPRL
jgi:hypothetical protein